jgi:hypothetical protein
MWMFGLKNLVELCHRLLRRDRRPVEAVDDLDDVIRRDARLHLGADRRQFFFRILAIHVLVVHNLLLEVVEF